MNEVSTFSDTVLEVSDFVALVNQTFEYAYPVVTLRGEVANLKISKNKWVYFDLKDESASVRCFGLAYQIGQSIEAGMLLRVRATPRLHPQYGFSINIRSVRPEGEGALRRAADLLAAQLAKEGLFDDSRKRSLRYPPRRIALITSTESAAYADFIKILGARWRGLDIDCIDVRVQGESAAGQIVAAIEQANQLPILPDVIVITRGGGSPDDLYAFNTEPVVRAVAGSRIPTLVAIGHEIDRSLAELAADRRASTPSNAAEMLVPDQADAKTLLSGLMLQMGVAVATTLGRCHEYVSRNREDLEQGLVEVFRRSYQDVSTLQELLSALDPRSIMRRGYAIVRSGGRVVTKTTDVDVGNEVSIELAMGNLRASILGEVVE